MDFGDLLGDGGFGEFDDQGGSGEGAMSNDLFMFGMNTQEIEEMKTQKDSVIFLIDCHKSMHVQNPHNGADQESNIEQVLRAALSFVKTKIITNENDKVGIVLYGCGESANPLEQGVKNENSLNFKNIHVMYSLDIPDASLIKQLETKITTFSRDHGHFDENGAEAVVQDPTQINSSALAGSSLSQSRQAETGSSLNNSSPRSPLFEALWICHQEFKMVEKQSFSKRIFLFTDSDCPSSLADQKMALQRAKDLESLDVDIELFPMPNCHQMRPMFDIRKFFASIITFDEEEVANGLLDVEAAQARLFELMKRIRQKEFKKRTQGKCMFEIAGNTKIGMSFFTTVLPTRKPTAKKVQSESNKPLQTTSKLVCEETGVALYRNQIGTYYPLGGEKVRLDQTEMKKIKNFGTNGMKLMGFKPRDYLKVYHNIKHSYFIFPDEKKTTGGGQCTDALIKEMLAQDKVAIVKLIPRENSAVRFCAMVAQEEKVDPQDGFQTPAGFQMIPLPYADDLRGNKEIVEYAGLGRKNEGGAGIAETLTDTEKHAAKLLIKNLNIDFDSRNFQNPTIQKFFSGLQALALNEDEPEQVQDDLEPDYEGLKKFAPVIGRFKDVFYNGAREDPECAEKPRPARGARGAPRGRGRGGARAAAGGTREVLDFASSQSEVSSRGGKGRGKARKDSKTPDNHGMKQYLPGQKSGTAQQLAVTQEQPPADEASDLDMPASKRADKRRKLNDGRAEGDQQAHSLLSQSKNEGRNGRVAAPRGSRSNSPKSNKADKNADQKFRDACADGSIRNFKVAELKEFLTLKSIPATGVKSFLITLVNEYFDNCN